MDTSSPTMKCQLVYDEVSKIIGEYIGKPCPLNTDNLPAPRILSIKANVHPPRRGWKHTASNVCYSKAKSFYPIGPNCRNEKYRAMGKIVTRGRNVLNAYISLYCGEK